MNDTVEVLVIARSTDRMLPLQTGLAESDIAMDAVSSRHDALERFGERGGHRVVVFGPDVGKDLLQETLRALRSVDPALQVVSFGRQNLALAKRLGLRVFPDFHPASRAGIGAVRRFLLQNV